MRHERLTNSMLLMVPDPRGRIVVADARLATDVIA